MTKPNPFGYNSYFSSSFSTLLKHVEKTNRDRRIPEVTFDTTLDSVQCIRSTFIFDLTTLCLCDTDQFGFFFIILLSAAGSKNKISCAWQCMTLMKMKAWRSGISSSESSKKSKLPKHKGCKRKGCRLLLLSLEKYKVITEKWNWYAWEVPYSSWICSIFLLDQRTCDTPGTKDVFRYYHYILCSHLAFSHFLSSVSSCIIYACNILTKHARMQNRAQVKRRQSTWGTNILKEKMEKTAA